MLNFTTLPPLSLYIHYPWCARKCPYCDFNSHTVSPRLTLDEQQRDEAYVDALLADLQQELPGIWGRRVQSIFIGGGTPSLMQPEALQRLLEQLNTLLNLSPFIEITLEANPGTVEQSRFSAFRAAGINRLSIGIQSFNDQHLHSLGRIHTSAQAAAAIEQAQSAGFENLNLDLMYALPGQTLKQALQDVEQAIKFNPTHLSHYQLTLEPNTFFASHPPELPDDDLSHDMQILCQERIAAAGYEHYEISAYAHKGHRCQHNLNYWQFGDYLGIGAGAHGKISDASSQTITRRWKTKHPQSYLEQFSVAPVSSSGLATISTNDEKSSMMKGEEQLSIHDIGFEFMLNASRLVDGIDTQLFSRHTGLSLSQIETSLNKALELELIEWRDDHIKPTERGLRYLNELQAIFL
jgi:oxygen-independent coproporphyrinogen-3 oxidase